ncbi:MAG TPA: YdbL family protein [Phenylobacterium sp.]
MTRQKVLAAIAGAAGALLLASTASGQSAQAKAAVDAAKGRGEVGEQMDGFLGVRAGGDAEVRAAVAEINAGRAQLYREAAQRNGVSPEAAGAAAFQEVVKARIKPGEYYRDANGQWVRK